jgi:hypothetical protein
MKQAKTRETPARVLIVNEHGATATPLEKDLPAWIAQGWKPVETPTTES